MGKSEEKHEYIDNVLIKLKREYGKDELVMALNKQLSDKDVEIGQLKSEIEHLERELQGNVNQREINRLARIEARKDKLYRQQSEKINAMEKRNKVLMEARDQLLARANNFENQLKKFLKKESE